MVVSLCVIAYNEQNTINNLFEDIKNQDYPHNLIEVVLVDGNSSDNTKQMMRSFESEDNGFIRTLILDNEKRTLPCGWNVALSKVRGDVILKVDAHASISKDFISKNIVNIKKGEKISGGQRPNIIDEPTAWKKTLLLAEESIFGSGIAPYRRETQCKYVKSMFHAAYAKEIFDKIGGFNEKLNRTEDNEIHYRMRCAGYKFYFDPSIISYQHTRNTLKKMLKQKYANGFWIGKTLKICPKCLAIFHFVPFVFVLLFTLCTVLAFCASPMFVVLFLSLYFAAAIIMAIKSSIKEKFNITCFSLPIIFFLMHFLYGWGTLIGIIK